MNKVKELDYKIKHDSKGPIIETYIDYVDDLGNHKYYSEDTRARFNGIGYVPNSKIDFEEAKEKVLKKVQV